MITNILASISGAVFTTTFMWLIFSFTGRLSITKEVVLNELYIYYYKYHPKFVVINDYVEYLKKILYKSGNDDIPAQSFLIIKEIYTIIAFLLLLPLTGMFPAFLFALSLFIYPDVKLVSVFTMKIEAIRKDFPDFVDLLSLIVASGIDFTTALDKISSSFIKGPLKIELQNFVVSIKSGISKKDALERWSNSLDLDEIRLFSSLIIQAEETGTGISVILKNIAERVREERFVYIEKKSAQLPVKMMLPLFIIFAAILMVIFSLVFGQISGVL